MLLLDILLYDFLPYLTDNECISNRFRVFRIEFHARGPLVFRSHDGAMEVCESLLFCQNV